MTVMLQLDAIPQIGHNTKIMHHALKHSAHNYTNYKGHTTQSEYNTYINYKYYR
jgi:hypothetical protein